MLQVVLPSPKYFSSLNAAREFLFLNSFLLSLRALKYLKVIGKCCEMVSKLEETSVCREIFVQPPKIPRNSTSFQLRPDRKSIAKSIDEDRERSAEITVYNVPHLILIDIPRKKFRRFPVSFSFFCLFSFSSRPSRNLRR